MKSKYLVVHTGSDCNPCYSGMSSAVLVDSIDEAKVKVKDFTDQMCDLHDIDLEPGDCLDEDMNDCEECGARYAAYFYSESGLTSWVNGQSDSWEKVETWEVSDDGIHIAEGPNL